MLTEQAGANLIKETFKTFSNAVDKGVGLEETKPSPELISALKENAFVFSGFKTHAELEQAASMLTDENGNLKGFERFLNDVLSINKDYNHNYLRSEYNQAVQSAQMAAKWQGFEKNKNFINLQYRTANDERVRASHRKLHGVTLPVDDPFWKQYTPPNGWGCRCTVAEVLKEDYPVQDSHGSIAKAESCFKTPKEKMFKENLAEKKRLFPSKHPYLPKGCGECKFKKLIFENEKAICKACHKVDSASAKWSRETVRNHYYKILNGKTQKWEINNGPVKEVKVSKSNIDVLVGKAHNYQFAKNMAIYYLKQLLMDTSKVVYIGSSDDIKGNASKGHTPETIWHYYKLKFLHGYSYISIKEYNGECIVHHIQDDEHFDEGKIKYKVPYSLKASKPTSCV